MADVSSDADDLRELTRRHLADLDARLADLARVRERVRAVEDRLLGGDRPGDEALLDLLSGLPADEPAVDRADHVARVPRHLGGARLLVDVLGLAAGPISYDGDRAVHGEVHPGDGVVWLHREAPEHRMVSPLTTGTVTASLAVLVDDIDAHYARVATTGAAIDYEPTDIPYGVREYSVRDPSVTSGRSRHRSPSSTNRRPDDPANSLPLRCRRSGRHQVVRRNAGRRGHYEPIVMDDGRVGHCELAIGEACWMMSDPFDSAGVAAPDPARGSAVSLHLTVTDVDEVAATGPRQALMLRSCALGGRIANVAKTMMRLLKRSGHDVTIADNVGQKDATLTRIDESVSVREEGSFTFGYCKSCNWAGSARRARGKARRDAIAHLPECPGKGKVRIGVSEDSLIVAG